MGLLSAAAFYLYRSYSGSSSGLSAGDRRAILKRELLNELSKFPIDPPKDEDYLLTKDFMILLFRLVFTYKTIGREIVKEDILEKRIAHLRAEEHSQWESVMDSRPKEF